MREPKYVLENFTIAYEGLEPKQVNMNMPDEYSNHYCYVYPQDKEHLRERIMKYVQGENLRKLSIFTDHCDDESSAQVYLSNFKLITKLTDLIEAVNSSCPLYMIRIDDNCL